MHFMRGHYISIRQLYIHLKASSLRAEHILLHVFKYMYVSMYIVCTWFQKSVNAEVLQTKDDNSRMKSYYNIKVLICDKYRQYLKENSDQAQLSPRNTVINMLKLIKRLHVCKKSIIPYKFLNKYVKKKEKIMHRHVVSSSEPMVDYASFLSPSMMEKGMKHKEPWVPLMACALSSKKSIFINSHATKMM